MARLARYTLSKQQDDLEQSILCLTEAILVPLPWDTSPLNIAATFNFIPCTILLRAEESRQLRDVKCCILYLRHLHGQCRELPIHFPRPVITALINALAVRGELEPRDVDRGVEEMADLCHELLDSDISIESLPFPICPSPELSMLASRLPSKGNILPRKSFDAFEEQLCAYQIFTKSLSCLLNLSLTAMT